VATCSGFFLLLPFWQRNRVQTSISRKTGEQCFPGRRESHASGLQKNGNWKNFLLFFNGFKKFFTNSGVGPKMPCRHPTAAMIARLYSHMPMRKADGTETGPNVLSGAK
jgi:hypothetical protein